VTAARAPLDVVPEDRRPPSTGPLVVVTVGTDHHRFDRVLRWVERWYVRQDVPVQVLAQTGTADPPARFPSRRYLAPGELESVVGRATAVVTHGGPATVMGVRDLGLLPVVVPREATHGEHIDDHQERFARWLAERQQIALATTEPALHHLLDAALVDPASFRLCPDGGGSLAVAVERFGILVDSLLDGRR
jgi:UDP-N-acetylglucosamine transferase subunit ALG13